MSIDNKDIKYLDVPISVLPNEKSDDGVILIEGWANRTKTDDGQEIKDRDNDVVLSFGLDNYKKNPILLYQHDNNKPAGKAVNVEVTDKGLYVQGEIYKAVNPEAYAAVKHNVVSTFSIGFRGNKGHYNPDSDTYYFTDTELLEISLVSVPANQDSIFDIVDTPCGDGFCLANKHYKKSKENLGKGGNEMDKDEVLALLKEFKDSFIEELKGSEGDVQNPQKDIHIDDTSSDEDNVDDATNESIDYIDVLKSVLDNLELDEDNIEEVVKLATQLNSKVNETVEKLLQ